MGKHWTGIYPAVTTKFRENEDPDIEEMERCFKFQFDAGVHGLIVNGSLGEVYTMDAAERLEVLKVAKRVAGDKPVLYTVVDGSTQRVADQAVQAAKAGADGLMVLPGVPYKSQPHETAAHLRTVARTTGLPVMIYNTLRSTAQISPRRFSPSSRMSRCSLQSRNPRMTCGG